jgi:hypothetical protein
MQHLCPKGAHAAAKSGATQATERHVMRPQNEFSEDRAAELCLLQMAIEATEQVPKFWTLLKNQPVGCYVADHEQAAILDLYLLLWIWGYLRSQSYFVPRVHKEFSGAKLCSRLRQLPFDFYTTISVIVSFGPELLAAA